MSTELIIYEQNNNYNKENKKVIPVDFNIIELPLFSKNNKAKINIGASYVISAKKNIKVDIIPVVGMSIPIDFDKKVYFALVQIAQEYKVKNKCDEIPKNIFTTFYEIYTKLGVPWKGGKTTADSMFPVGGTKDRIYQSLSKLAGTKYKLFNCFYDSTIARKDENLYESTFIHSIRILKMSKLIEEGHEALNFVKSHSNEIVQLQLNPFFLTNIINKKGHLKHSLSDYNKLEDSTARDIYFWCEKNRKWLGEQQYGHDKRINVKVKKLAASIPLAFNSSNIPKTVYRVREAFEFLLKTKLISNFLEHRSENGEPLSETWYEVGFEWSRDDKEYITTGRETFEIESISESKEVTELLPNVIKIIDEKQNDENPKIIRLVKPVQIVADTFKKQLTNKTKQLLNDIYLQNEENNSLLFIRASFMYAKKNSKTNFDKYLQDTLINEWALPIMNNLIEKEESSKKEKLQKKKIFEEEIKKAEIRKEQSLEIKDKYFALTANEQTAIFAELLERVTSKAKTKLPEILKDQENYIISYWAQKNGWHYDGSKQLFLTSWKVCN